MSQVLCSGCATPLPPGRRRWCSARCKKFARDHPNELLRIFRRCKRCEVEIDHMPPHVHYCDRECREEHRPQREVERRQKLRADQNPRLCARCGVDISKRSIAAKYCSDHCRGVARGVVRSEPLPLRRCALPECRRTFQPWLQRQRCCCEKHGKVLYNRESRADGRQKPPAWSDQRRDRYHRRRAQKKATSTGEPVLLEAIAGRDRWRCHVCGKRVGRKIPWPDPRSPSLDHIVPLSQGGVHEPANVQLAHLGCNSARSNRGGGEQLLLIG